jgi:penicillin-binding protein 1A
VTTADGELLYRHRDDESRVLVAPWVSAQMTDLLQTAVLTGTGRAAQIGRPVAGKTGTTSSNKDGWFIGFSSGLTTGVWMGRDDARAVPGMQGGRAPAEAFHDFMVQAVARRPVEAFEIEVTPPDWQIEPDEEAWFGEPGDPGMMVDEDGNPLYPTDPNAPLFDDPVASQEGGERLDQEWLDRAVGRNRQPTAPPPPPESRLPPQRVPAQRAPARPSVPPEPVE